MVVAMKERLKSLCNEGNLKICNQHKYMVQNKNSLKILEDRRKSNNISIKYTATYDVLFFFFYLELNHYGYTLNKSPHAVFKKLYPVFFPDVNEINININEVVQIRHRVKKGRYIPTAKEFEILDRLYEHAVKNKSYDKRS